MLKKLIRKLCRWRTMKAHYHYLNGDITYKKFAEIEFRWKTIKAKWVRGECHHLCAFCDYKHECWSNAKE